MNKFAHILLLSIGLTSIVFGSEDKSNAANVENLKILRKSVNFAYKSGNEFLDLIRGDTLPYESMKRMVELHGKGMSKLIDYVQISMPFIGYIILVAIGLLFVIFMPIIGFCFCLCRCGGKCGGKIKGMDPKHATCKRYTYTFILGLISIIMLAGIVLAFINNQLIHDSLTNPSEEINAIKQLSLSSKIMHQSLKNISEEIFRVEKSSENYEGLIEKADFKSVISKQFFQFLRSESLNIKLKEDLERVSTGLSEFIQLLERVKKPNVNLQSSYSTLQNRINLIQIEKMQHSTESWLGKFKDNFIELKSLMKSQPQPDSKTGKLLKSILNEFNTSILPAFDKNLKTADQYLKLEYFEYRMYICIGVCCLLLLIVLFYFLGLCFGQCGERPFEDARICNRGVGANLMMAGVAFAFLFTPMIMILTISLFWTGGAMQTEFCRYLTNSYKPGVVAFDTFVNSGQKLINNNIIFPSNLVSLINRCPTVSMAMAFNINTDLLSQPVLNEITTIAEKAKSFPKDSIVNSYLQDTHSILGEIERELKNSFQYYENFDVETKEKINKGQNMILDEIKRVSLTSAENKIKSFFNTAESYGFNSTLANQVKSIFNKVYIGSYDSVRCVGMHKSAKILIDAVCITFLWPFNGFWYGVGICLVFTIPGIVFAVKLAGLYRRTEKYSADYEEPDYHSYMGFYTNNADNIPMKKPKAGKSNPKNRNSNYNNKDSLKQTNPQYLPVYPYDAYE